MVTTSEVEKLAFDLPDSQRAVLASHLLRSLPSVLYDEDEGIAEALQRDAEFDANPDIGITLERLDELISARRSWCRLSCIPKFIQMSMRSWGIIIGSLVQILLMLFMLS